MLVVAVGFIMRWLPRSAALRLGSGIGGLLYRFVKRRRQIALNNLKMAFGDEREDEELKQIARASFQNMGKTLAEFLRLPKYSREHLLNLVQIDGIENLYNAMTAGKGVILVSAHLGNWEFGLHVIAMLTNNISGVVQKLNHNRLDRLVNSYRTSHGAEVIERGTAVRPILRRLRQGQGIAIMSDQNAGDGGVFVDFFGIPASTPRGPIMFALRTGASVICIFDIRQDDDSHLLTMSKPLELKTSGDLETDIKVNTARVTKHLEKVIRKYPPQWLWMHNRWKTRPKPIQSPDNSSIQYPASSIQHPAPSILVLSDGKPGHYNQSLGIIDRMNGVSMEIIQIKFRQKWRDNLLRISTRLLAGIKLPAELIKAMMKWSLESASAAALLGSGHFDAILSTGSSTAALNLLLGRLLSAKTAVCMRPSPVGINHFDLAIVPEHLRPRRKIGQVVMTLGVPNRITPQYVRIEGERLTETLKIDRQHVIGLLLGGDDRHYSIPPNMVSLLCDVLLDICREIDAHLALTTSRRTNPRSEDAIRSKMLDDPSCCFAILASEPQQGNPVPSILGISHVTIVTEDSFSMVCEAASSGRKVVILTVERRKRGDLARQRVYKLLTERGYARMADISNLKNVILDFVNDSSRLEILDDAQTAACALRNLINGRQDL